MNFFVTYYIGLADFRATFERLASFDEAIARAEEAGARAPHALVAPAAATDIVMKAEILSYSRAQGLFAGVSLEGSTLRSDDGANKTLYGKELSAKEIVREGKVVPPASAKRLLAILSKASPRHVSK